MNSIEILLIDLAIKMKQSRLWTKDFIVVSTVNFLISLIFYILMVTIAVYAVETYNASMSQAGLSTGVFIIGAMIGRLSIGSFIDSIGRKRTLLIGLLMFMLATLLYFVKIDTIFLLFSRFIHGMAIGIASTAAGTIAAQIIPKAKEGEGISYYSMSKTFATAIGPFIGIFMTSNTSYEFIFSLCFILGLISFVTAGFIRVPPLDKLRKINAPNEWLVSKFIELKVLPIAIIVLAIAFCYSSVLSFINIYALEIDLMEAASYFFIVYSVTVLVSRPFTGRLMDIKGANFVMYPAFVIFSAGMLLLGTANSALTILVAAILIGLGFGNMQSITQAITIKLTPPERMGLAISTFFIFMELGLGFGPYLLGLVTPITGFRNVYVLIGVFILVILILYASFYGKGRTLVKRHVDTSL